MSRLEIWLYSLSRAKNADQLIALAVVLAVCIIISMLAILFYLMA